MSHIIGSYAKSMDWLWQADLRQLKGVNRFVVISIRMLFVMMRSLINGQLSMRAMSLVYTTLLSVVPLLAVMFSVLKGFGVHNQIEPLLVSVLAPLGSRSQEITDNVIGFVENVKVGVLGALGLIFLLYTVVSLIQKIEGAFNYVWQVERLRGLAQRFSNYLSVILIGPVLIFTALGITASVMNNSLMQQLVSIEPFGHLMLLVGKVVPYLLVVTAFTFIYLFIPNTRVRLLPAFAGGLAAGILWETVGWGFAAFIASSSNYAAIYSGFAIMILLLIWLYLSWLILLLGAQVGFYLQFPQYMSRRPVQPQLSGRMREYLALQVMYLIGLHHVHKKEPWTLERLVHYLGVPMQPVHKVLGLMVEIGYLAETADEFPAYLPRCDIENIKLLKLLDVVRNAGETQLLDLETLNCQKPVTDTIESIQQAVKNELGDRTLKDMIEGKVE